MIELCATRAVVGLCHLYNWQPFERTAWFSVIIEASLRGSGLGFEATGLFLRRTFNRWPVDRLLAHSLAPNFEQMGSLLRRSDRGYENYGTMQGRVILDGEPCDVHVIGIVRDRWMATHGTVIERAQTRATS